MRNVRKDRASSVPAAAVIPTVQIMTYTGFKTCEACLYENIEGFHEKRILKTCCENESKYELAD